MRSSSWPPGKLKRIHRDGSNVTTTRTDANQMAEWEDIMSSSFLCVCVCVCVCVASVAHAGRKEDTPSSSLNELRQRPPMLQPPPRSLLQSCWQCPFKCEISIEAMLPPLQRAEQHCSRHLEDFYRAPSTQPHKYSTQLLIVVSSVPMANMLTLVQNEKSGPICVVLCYIVLCSMY